MLFRSDFVLSFALISRPLSIHVQRSHLFGIDDPESKVSGGPDLPASILLDDDHNFPF